jgi:predicted helicase
MSSQHPRQHTLPDGLFRGLSSFRELEDKIARLSEELERGDALEIFVEAYLWLTNICQVQDLWLVGQIPLAVRTTLNLPSDHKGVDGAFRTRTGTLVPYQVKHRIGRPKVGVAEVATFLGLTERATDRVLISNATRYATDVENRDHLRLITGADFDTLTAIELQGIANWLDGRPTPPTRYAPDPHQTRALTDIAATLTTHPRATVVMACATGKTLVALWATEQQHPATVLVLVPSLLLLKQLLGEWSQQTQWGDRFEYLCVCSDKDAVTRNDAIHLRPTEVPFPVDTDPAVVRGFLDRPSTGSVRVVFSTYHSATVVAEGVRRQIDVDQVRL